MYSGKRVADKPLTEDQMIGETLAILAGDYRIWSAGTYWERNKFTNRTYFAPYAYKLQSNTRKFRVEDLARLNKTGKTNRILRLAQLHNVFCFVVVVVSEELYTNQPFFKFLKQRWSTNFDSLEKYYFKMRIRFNETGETTRKFEHFPTFFRAARLEHGTWSTPYYDCDGKVPMWKIQYSAPFFGWDSLKAKLEFK